MMVDKKSILEQKHSPLVVTYVFSLVFFMVGIFLRCWRIGQIQIFGDEIHTLKCAAQKSFYWIATHFETNDACIPYTLYNKFFLVTTGLTEWIMRLPVLISGILLILVCFVLIKRHANPVLAIFVVGFMSLSPYLVYLSREARPYAVTTFLFTVVCLNLIVWRKYRCPNLLNFSAVILAFGVYLHPIIIPSAFTIWLYPLAVILHDGSGTVGRKNYVLASTIGLIFSVFFLGPPFFSLLDGFFQKAAEGSANIATATDGLVLLHGLPIRIPLWVWISGFCIGSIGLFKKSKIEAVFLIKLLVVQMSVIYFVQPNLAEIPWVWIRYWIHLFPILLIGFCIGIREIFPKYKIPMRPEIIAMVLLLVIYGIWHASEGNYNIEKYNCYPVHPMNLMMPAGKKIINDVAPLSPFYKKKVLNLPEKARLVESPRLYSFPLYGLYSRIHGKNILTAGAGNGFGQKLFENHSGFCFSSIWNEKLRSKTIDTFWIHHKNIKEEMGLAFKKAMNISFLQPQISRFGIFSTRFLDLQFGENDALNSFAPENAHLIYEDNWIKLYKLL